MSAAAVHELDGAMEIRLARGQALRQRQRVARLDQDVKAPALDLRALVAVVFEDLGHLAHASRVRAPIDEPCQALLACRMAHDPSVSAGAKALELRDSLPCQPGELVGPPAQLLEARLEDCTLRFHVGGELRQAASKLRLELGHARLEGRDRFVAVPLEPGRDLAQATLHPLRALVADVRHAFGEHRLGLACERVHCALELARQPPRGVLARRADERRELLPRLLAHRGRGALDRALELLDLTALHVLEPRLDAAEGLALLALDLLGDLAFPTPQALLELVERAAPLERARLEIGARCGQRLVHRALDLLAEPRERGALLLAFDLEPVGVDEHAALRLGHELALPLRELADAAGERVGGALEVLRPGRETLLDLVLRARERLRQLAARLALAL